jgi:hypothetical protein
LFLSGEDALIHVNPGVEFGDEWMPAYVGSRQSENRPNREEIAFSATVSDERSVCLGNPFS